jgi:UDP:flavonoid glycosyltransferase YjiC (YdhE family)
VRPDPGLPPAVSVLLRSGFAEDRILSARVHHWRKLIMDVQPALIVADFAPSLILAARGRVPVVCVGNGFTIPSFDPRRAEQLPEQAIMTASRRVATKFGLSPPSSLADLFRGDRTFVFTQKELDPCQAFRSEQTYVPYNIELPERTVPLECRRSDHAAVYLPGFHRHLGVVLKCLQAQQLAADIYVPGLTAAPTIGNSRFHHQPMPLDEILNNVMLLIHHGGLGTAHAGLFTGTPQITLPVAQEHKITAHCLRQFGMTASYPYQGHTLQPWLEQAIDALCTDPAVPETAAALQARFSSVRTAQRSTLQALLSCCAEWI